MKRTVLSLSPEDASCLSLCIADGLNVFDASDKNSAATIEELESLHYRLEDFEENFWLGAGEKQPFEFSEKETKLLKVCIQTAIDTFGKAIKENKAADFAGGMIVYYESILEAL